MAASPERPAANPGPTCESPVRFRILRALSALCAALAALSAAQPQAADDALALGARLQSEGKLELAAEAYERALQLAPGRVDAISNLAVARLGLGQPERAIQGLRRAREAVPGHSGVAYYLGLALFQSGRLAEAREELAWVLERQPSNNQALHLYGLCLLKLGEMSQGISVLEKVLAAAPANRQASYTLGSAYIKAGRVERAEQLAERHLAEDESAEAQLVRGSLHIASKEYAEALRSLERAAAGGADLPTLRSQTGVALLYAGQRDRAAREFEAELARNPADFNANALLGWLVHQDGDPDRALDLLGTAYDLNRDDTGVKYLLAQAHSGKGNWPEARALLEQVVEAQPEFAPAHVMLARAYAKLQRTDLFRERQRIIRTLNAAQQQRDLQGVDHLYEGRVLPMPGR